MFKIIAPVKETGTGYGLTFVDGVAETDNEALAKKLQAKGYIIAKECNDEDFASELESHIGGDDDTPAVKVSEADSSQPDMAADIPKLSSMGRAQIDAYGETIGVDTKQAPNKEAAIALIESKLQETE